MTWQIELKPQAFQPTLSIRIRTKAENLPDRIGESYMKINAYLEEIGEKIAGVPFTAYYNMDMKDLDVEIGFPVEKPLPGKGDIQPGTIPEGFIVSCMFKGHYSGMEPMYKEMFQWIADHDCVPTGVCYEYYYNSPMEVPESELLTRVDMVVTKK
ncbi:MAG TPA: AraC family transcriptional regulator [Peptococcaceae bacterium]|nr:AraC family transcriptional regulator [Peptococcaceae bacterium]